MLYYILYYIYSIIKVIKSRTKNGIKSGLERIQHVIHFHTSDLVLISSTMHVSKA